MITRNCFFGLCAHGWFNVFVTVPPAPRRYPNVLSSVEPLKHKDLHVSTQSTSETSRTCAVQAHQFSGAGRLLFPPWTHIWRRWDYANTWLLRPWICPDKNILAFLPLPRGQHWRHLLAETRASHIKQRSRVHTAFLGNFFILPEKRATEDIRPLWTGCCKIQQCAKKQEWCTFWLMGNSLQNLTSAASLQDAMWTRMLLLLSAAEFSSARTGKHLGRNAVYAKQGRVSPLLGHQPGQYQHLFCSSKSDY